MLQLPWQQQSRRLSLGAQIDAGWPWSRSMLTFAPVPPVLQVQSLTVNGQAAAVARLTSTSTITLVPTPVQTSDAEPGPQKDTQVVNWHT